MSVFAVEIGRQNLTRDPRRRKRWLYLGSSPGKKNP